MDSQSKTAIIAIILIIPLASITVWNSEQSIISFEKTSSSKISVLTSFYPLFEFTKQVGGEHVDVSLLIPTGVEPHDWEPTIRDVQKMGQADLIIINGNGFENWIHKVDFSGVSIINSGESITTITDYPNDPHYWLNPITAKQQVETITAALIETDPDNVIYYLKSKNDYILKLDELDNKIKSELNGCKKDFIAFHNSFSYFAKQYDLNQHTVTQSTGPLAEPTAKTLEQIILLAKELDTKVIFTEEAVNIRSSQVIANEIGGKVLVLSSLEISQDDSDYITKMEENLSNLKEALCN